MARTRFSVNDDPRSAFQSLVGDLLLIVIDYRAFVHPVTGVPMRPEVASEVENYLQHLILSKRVRSTRALKLSSSRYLVAEPFVGATEAGTRYMRYVRGLTRTLLTPSSSGFRTGVPFWGSCSALAIGANDLRATAPSAGANGLEALISLSKRPDFMNTFYATPLSTSLVDGPAVGADAPELSPRPIAEGSYPGSVRLQVARRQPSRREPRLFDAPATLGSIGDGLAARHAMDDWGTWTEIVPFATSTEDAGSPAVDDDAIGFDVLRDLEPLIADLWRQYAEWPGQNNPDLVRELGALREEFEQLHIELIEVSDAVRAGQRGRLARTLIVLLTIALSVGGSLTATIIWDQYADEIRKLLERVGG